MLLSSRPDRPRRGTTITESAIVMGIFLTFLLAVFEYGRFIMMRNLLDNAAREGARQATITTSTGTTSQITTTVTNWLLNTNTPLTNINIQVYKIDPSTGANLGSWNSASFGQAIAVDVTADYNPMLPTFGFLQNPTHLRTRSVMRSEYIQ
jgi:Flp pilus assembly protein TadG